MKRLLMFLCITHLILIKVYSQLTNPRVPAEWEEVQGVVLCIDTLDMESDPLSVASYSAQCEIMKVAIAEGIEVYCLYGASVSPADDIQQHFGISPSDVNYIYYDKGSKIGLPDVDHNVTQWLRDTGPMSVYNNETGELYFGNWHDDHAARLMAEELSIPRIDLQEPGVDDIRFHYTDGGNLLTDGFGNMFIDKFGCEFKGEVYANGDEVNNIFKNTVGMDNIVTMDAELYIHVDYYMKLVNEETIIMSSIPESNYVDWIDEIENPNHFRTQGLETVKNQIENLTAITGRKYKVEVIPNVPTINIMDFSDPDNPFELQLTTSNMSYTNSLIINNTVLVPQYSIPGHFDASSYDKYAIDTYKRLMPGYNIVGIPHCWGPARGSGVIHCLTREIASENPIWIQHNWMNEFVSETEDMSIEATIKSQLSVSVNLYWKKAGDENFTKVVMQSSDNEVFEAKIPGHPEGTGISYYIEANAASGKRITKPYVAPRGYYTYYIGEKEVNEKPILSTIGNKTIKAEEILALTVSATDNDEPSQSLAFSLDAESKNKGMNIDEQTGEFTWTPDLGSKGSHNVTIRVSDGVDETSETIVITVAVDQKGNQAPIITMVGNLEVRPDESTEIEIKATDVDQPAQNLEFSLDTDSKNKGMQINESTGMLTWVPASSDVGTHHVVVTVSDGELNDTESFTITVSNATILTVGVSETISVFPNPCSTILRVSGNTAHFATIHNAMGVMVSDQNIYSDKINVEGLQSGLYILILKDEAGQIVYRTKIYKQ